MKSDASCLPSLSSPSLPSQSVTSSFPVKYSVTSASKALLSESSEGEVVASEGRQGRSNTVGRHYKAFPRCEEQIIRFVGVRILPLRDFKNRRKKMIRENKNAKN